ncbi:lipopolysaccharide assembly protein LapB [Paenibacillus sp. J2TS4]|uniref:tetratricopeptide repeat protein n=1 Tax=Paenibacillus sp. J2TS4 TaxID=2807194 RepID=UPI001B11576B|nr:tetratricopeptide repeat protein [Paenibacillus sp. J2TS4]GIP35773.1 hypothetical protein J2TS4_49830 [Paenibacillus sp. J2TS4]
MDNARLGTGSVIDRSLGRFPSYLKKNLVHIRHNLYLNRGDPAYYDKVLRYVDPSSAEAHYHLGQKYERQGNYSKALHHYLEAGPDLSSPYSLKARSAMRNLLEEESPPRHPIRTGNDGRATAGERRNRSAVKPILGGMILINILLLTLLLLMWHG